jgi:hypothetical protein
MVRFGKLPLIKAGTMMYLKDDPEKRPYRWKIWDDAERDRSGYEFLNKKEAKYIYTLEIKISWYGRL